MKPQKAVGNGLIVDVGGKVGGEVKKKGGVIEKSGSYKRSLSRWL